jgi:UDP-N-acetylmuramate--alanine ligase
LKEKLQNTNPILKHAPQPATGMGAFQLNTALLNASFAGVDKVKEVYFIGIGGIGMSALAKFFKSKAIKVSGYDKTATALTKELEASGIAVHYTEDVEAISKKTDLVIYTPAIPAEHKELQYYQSNGYKVEKRSDVLERITAGSFNICIAGTHGKTTITTMIGHLLRDSGFGCNAFLGGMAVNYGTNFWGSEKNVCVIEADEYDRSFLKLNPDIAIVSAMDADHLDIYGTVELMEQAFIDFSKKLRPGGLFIGKFGLKRTKELHSNSYLSYSLQNESADIYGSNIKMVNGGYEFDVVVKDNLIENIKLQMGGMHNVENAIAAIAVASYLGIENEKIKKGIENFRGVKRRFEYIIKNDRMVFIDDYAHHPEELKALINAAKNLFRQKKCTVIFQPHLYSRTKDHADAFAEVLDMADEVVLLPIYPARELPVKGVNSELILDKMNKKNKAIVEKDNLVSWISNQYINKVDKEFGEVLITAGAGDIDTMVEPIKQLLKNL